MRNKLTQELAVCGYNAAKALADIHPERINRLFLREDRLKAFGPVCKLLAERKRPYKLCADEELERICKSNRHQGVVVMIEEPEVERVGETDIALWVREGKLGLILHEVGNDHNLGAIVRSAAFFDAHFIILSEKDEEARLTTSAYRVAEGGMEHLVFRKVGSTADFLRRLSRSVITIGADVRARQRIQDLGTIIGDKTDRSGIALVLGNEETGLPPEVQDQCGALVRIPGTGALESLNVAHTATIFLHELYEL